MSLAILLEATKTHLLNEVSFTDANNLGIEPDGMPPHAAGKHYVAIDEGNIRQESNNAEFINEVFEISVYVCRRPMEIPNRRQGQLYLKTSVYQATQKTLEQMERPVIAALHGNWSLMNDANTLGGFPNATDGDVYQSPWMYRGRGTTDVVMNENDSAWIRRQLRFEGMRRVQEMSIAG